jgi:hypothetical protein
VSDPVRQIADAVLYEGYVLWPYRRSALKNQRRWTFGGVFPPAWSAEHPDDPAEMRTQCLLEGSSADDVSVEVRFLHVVARQALDAAGSPVDEVTVDGERLVSWEEATERSVSGAAPIRVPAGGRREGALERTWEGLEGEVAVEVERVGDDLHRITVRVANTTPFDGGDRQAALRRTFCSTHTVLRTRAGAFVSLTDPPPAFRTAAEACQNRGTWPVLAGEPGARDTVLSSPIILEDHPRIAPESPGDLFDGGEIDQLLTLSILSMTDEEKREMREADPRAREILDRTEALSEDELMRLHGTIRELRAVRG